MQSAPLESAGAAPQHEASTDRALYSDAVLRQQEEVPGIYGRVDFSRLPERFTTDLEETAEIPPMFAEMRSRLLSDPDQVALMRNYTMTGDRVADAYAALIPDYGFRALVDMLDKACDEGVEAVEDAPPELVAFIRAMEETPDWVDMKMVERGAQRERNAMANLSPYVIRGAFIATFMNKYSALPMSMTGTLSNTTSAKRVFETASFFTATILPGALERKGAGFKAAAKVRLMHSMVRFNIMRTNKWDVETYGVPIPQVDQMPAGLIGAFLLSFKLLQKGRTEFTEDERCAIELSRYRCFLLGLPEELLGESPQAIADLMLLRSATLRSNYDDAICGPLVRSTMAAELSKDRSLKGRLNTWMERGFSKFYFVKNFCQGRVEKAESMGVTWTMGDRLAAGVAGVVILARVLAYKASLKVPVLKDAADRRLVEKLKRLLDSYGHADFITDAAEYKPTTG